MKKNYRTMFFALSFALAMTASGVAQTKSRVAAKTAASSAATTAVAALPASDAALFVDVQRLLIDVLPRIYANEPTKLAQINDHLDGFKTRTGLDARAFDRVAVGMRFVPVPNRPPKIDSIALAHGRINADALLAAARIAAGGKYQEEKYKGKSIYVFHLNDQVRLLGLFNVRVTELAVSALDANTLALGKAERVRAAIDANSGGARIADAVAALATRDPNAVIGFGGNAPASLTQQLDFLNPEISRSIAAIRQFYGTFGTTAGGYQMLTALRTDNADAARTLSQTVDGLKQLAPFAISQMTGERAKLTQSLVDNTKVSTQGNEVQVRLDVTQADASNLLRVF